MLCQACTQIFENQLKPGIGLQHHSTVIELQRASDNGCQLCRLLCTTFSKCVATAGLTQKDDSVTYQIESGKDTHVIGYRHVPKDLYLLGFSLNTAELVTSTNEKHRNWIFIVEPFEGWSSLRLYFRATSSGNLEFLIMSKFHRVHWSLYGSIEYSLRGLLGISSRVACKMPEESYRMQ